MEVAWVPRNSRDRLTLGDGDATNHQPLAIAVGARHLYLAADRSRCNHMFFIGGNIGSR